MDEPISDITTSLERYLEELVSVLIAHGAIAVYLFGSRVSGATDGASDIDLAVLFPSEQSAAGTVPNRLDLIATLEERTGAVPVDLVYLHQASPALRFKVVTRGCLLACSDDDERSDFEDVVIRDYLDLQPFLRRSQEDLQSVIREGKFFVRP